MNRIVTVRSCLLPGLVSAILLAMSLDIVAEEDKDVPAAGKRQPNAALKCWQAYASMSRTLNRKTRSKVDSCFDTPIDKTAQQAVADCEPAIALVHRAARLSFCDWEIDAGAGANTTIEHYEPVRALARLMTLSARTHFEKGLAEAGVRDIQAMLALGRHAGSNDLAVSRLMHTAIEAQAILTLARYLPKLSRDELAELRDSLKKMPKLRANQSRSSDVEEALQAQRTRRELLRAAVAVSLDGRKALATIKDPSGDGPFGYRETENGFVLQSALHKYVRVTVGD